MNQNQLTEAIQSLGLSEKEAKVYLAGLETGPSSVLKVALAANLKRTSVYNTIDSLRLKGLMRIEIKGFKKLFAAESPSKLESLLETRRHNFKKLLPELDGIYNLEGNQSFIKYYEGLEAIKGIYEELIRDVNPGEDYLILSDCAQWLHIDEDFFRDFTKRRAKLPIKIRMLLVDNEVGREWQQNARRLNAVIKLLPIGTNLITNLVFIPRRVVIQMLTPPINAIVIENKSVVQMHREQFEIIWKSIP